MVPSLPSQTLTSPHSPAREAYNPVDDTTKGARMAESSGQIDARLKKDGRYGKFRARVKALKAAGGDGKAAYWQAAAEFPADDETTDRRAPSGTWGDRTATPAERVDWAARAMGCSDMKPEDAPDAAAWGLYQWCLGSNRNRTRFWMAAFRQAAADGGVSSAPEQPEEEPDDSALELMKELVGE